MDVVRIYFSHQIRGKNGDSATESEMETNRNDALNVGLTILNYLRKVGLPVDMYIPAIHDEFIAIAWKDGMLTAAQVLEVDCKILDKRDILLAYSRDGYISGGMRIEIDYAKEHSIPIYQFSELNDKVLRDIMRMVCDVLDQEDEPEIITFDKE